MGKSGNGPDGLKSRWAPEQGSWSSKTRMNQKNDDDGSFWRRERDLNPRVQGTVDFESTAIPGYAISAASNRPANQT